MATNVCHGGNPSVELGFDCGNVTKHFEAPFPSKIEKIGKVTTLQELISRLHEEFDRDIVDVDRVMKLVSSYQSKPHEWKKYAKFDRYRYTRNLVDSGNGKFNIMVLCWGEGHGSAIHDHADAHCFMKVLEGTLSEIRFAYPKEENSENSTNTNCKMEEIGRSDLKLNEVCYINDSLGLHRVENPSHVNPSVSLHIYSPPFDSCSVFNQQTGQKTKCKVTFWSGGGDGKPTKEERIPEDN